MKILAFFIACVLVVTVWMFRPWFIKQPLYIKAWFMIIKMKRKLKRHERKGIKVCCVCQEYFQTTDETYIQTGSNGQKMYLCEKCNIDNL